MENTQYQNQESLASETMEEVVWGNNGNGLEKEDPGFNYGISRDLTNLGVFLKNEVVRLQALITDLEAKKQKAEKQVQVNKDILEKLSLIEKQTQEIISEITRVQKENETIFQQNVKKMSNNNEIGEPLSLQKIWQ